MVVRQDKWGLWIAAGGYAARPLRVTKFKVGERVKTRHVGGTPTAIVGDEDWTTSGEDSDDVRAGRISDAELEESKALYGWCSGLEDK